MGEAWLMKHPLDKDVRSGSNEAKVLYSSSTNRCWIITTYWNWRYPMYVESPRRWPEWYANAIRKFATKRDRTLYDVQTGASVMTCRTLGSDGYDDDCRYIRKVEASDL